MDNIALVCTSHVALLNAPGAIPDDVEPGLNAATDKLREFVREFDPDLVIQFGDDHNSGFSLSLMPAFCVGMRAVCIGDFDTSSGPLLTDEAVARELVASLHDRGVDVATSYAMQVDHGFTQAIDLLFGGIDAVPVVPVFINCGGDLRPPMHRVKALGDAVGAFCRGLGDRRVLLLGSGGLSHDPPLPAFIDAPPEVQQVLIDGIDYTPELLEKRTERILQAARDFAGANTGGYLELNPEWDLHILEQFERGKLADIAQYEDHWILSEGGRGGQEIRMWLAPFAALAAAAGSGRYVATQEYYRAVPELFVGYGMMHARAA
ncbi:MAG: 3-carboxyethylcatechol 2,3-dioxygenase [Pseudomonadota bacterium]